ncbi:MAG: aromatic amino acid transport family protein [Candidatus Yanofskybacteria bacterium]|nr:aromatic amino acid transport family protein [Candidatus Yanofskybacteria bacterium]
MPLPFTDKRFLHATAVLVGTMVGVGVFGIPFVFAKAGFFVGLAFLVFTAFVTYLANLLMAEIILRTHAPHQLTGYASKYIGPSGKRLMLLTNTMAILGALLAYLIVAGEFLNNIFSQFIYIQPELYSILFWFAASLVMLLRFRTTAWIEFFLTGLFIFVILMVAGLGASKVRLANLMTFTPEFWFLPYGVLLFAFSGITSIPIQRHVLEDKEHYLRKSILAATLLVAVLYLLFAFIIVGVSGEVTTPDAFSGLFDTLGSSVIILGSIFGVLTISTSYLMLSKALFDVFQLDYGLPKKWSWSLISLPPIGLFIAGFRTFIDTINIVGSVAIGLEMILLIFIFVQAKSRGDRIPEMSLRLPAWVLYVLSLMFAVGIAYALLW